MSQSSPFHMLHRSWGRILAWWLGELVGFLPQRLTGTIGPRHRLPIARPTGHGWVVEVGAKVRSLADWAARNRWSPVVLRLSPEAGLSRELALPAAALSSLPDLLRREMDRLMPWRGDEVWLSAQMLRRTEGGRKIEVELTVVPDTAVEPARRALAGLDVPIAAIELDGPGGKRILLPPGEDRAAAGRRRLRRAALAVAALFALAAVGAGGWIGWQSWQRGQEIAALQMRIAAARPAAEEVGRLRQEIPELSDSQRFLDEKRRSVPVASIVLESVSRLLPDDVWLTDLSIADTALRAGGSATDASALIGVLEGSGRFADTRFLAPSTRDRETGRDRFSVGARIEPRLEP
ncbi:PilN domain-containing protein [Inquilinus sp. YAF38]|uniref:PilN domain-containing protein n=1 Tax=Inquilinus sp. YAF38 TaxID=3233084 RepID=UPI003F90871A